MTLVLPRPVFALSSWPEDVASTWQERSARARGITRRTGTGRRQQAVVDEARRLLVGGSPDVLRGQLAERRFARAVVQLWALDHDLARRTMSTTLLESLRPSGRRPSRVMTLTLGDLLLDRFDLLDAWRPGLLAALADVVRDLVAALPARPDLAGRPADLVETFRAHGRFLLHDDGPRALARHLTQEGEDLAGWFRANHLLGLADGRYGQSARDAFYLVRIEDADPSTEGHDFLGALADEVVARAAAGDGSDRRFGHLALTALCDKPTLHPAAQWLETIVAIAGDPRLSRTTGWQTWWARVDARLREQAVRWMSGADLRAFLEAVTRYGEEQGKSDLTRMFVRRRRFLEGLYESGLIARTRLVLGPEVRSAVRRAGLSSADAAVYAENGARDKAVLLVDCGEFHLVEGSHNFKLYVYAGAAPASLFDEARRHFRLQDFAERLPAEHTAAHGPGTHVAVVHNGLWQSGALDFLAGQGIRVDERALLDDADFAERRVRRDGAAVRRPFWRFR